jgi:hypothetical protein
LHCRRATEDDRFMGVREIFQRITTASEIVRPAQ